MDLTGLVGEAMAGDGRLGALAWAESGAMWLTGRPDGPPLAGPARVALAMDALATRFAELAARQGRPVDVCGSRLLGERAAIRGLRRGGTVSCGRATRLLEGTDGRWLAVSLARRSDLELVPAWLDVPGPEPTPGADGPPGGDPTWRAVERAVASAPADEVVARAALLGLPCSALGEVAATGPILDVTVGGGRAAPPSLRECLVVDLSSLWAGPLCARLLGAAGARVVKVESTSRPDGARRGPPAFFDLLHGGHESVALPLAAPDGRRLLAALLHRADVVIEASRPRALAQMGIDAPAVRSRGGGAIWVSLTSHGSTGASAERVGFGDDVAVAGGLVAREGAGPVFCADAVGDPVSGLLAAVAVAEMVASGHGGVVDVSLARACAHLAAGVAGNDPVTGSTALDASLPSAPPAAARGPALGEHTGAVLGELVGT